MMKMMTCAAAGFVAALLIAQAAAPDQPEPAKPEIGRYQLQARANMPEVWVLDTQTGMVWHMTRFEGRISSTAVGVPGFVGAVGRRDVELDSWLKDHSPKKKLLGAE